MSDLAAGARIVSTLEALATPPDATRARERALATHVSAAPARLVLVDLARALASLMMLQGHTLDAVLSNDVRTGAGFQAWSFLRGQTSCLFFLLSGFAFTLATYGHWADNLTLRSRGACADSASSCCSATRCTCRSS